jgi:hypothetical protein
MRSMPPELEILILLESLWNFRCPELSTYKESRSPLNELFSFILQSIDSSLVLLEYCEGNSPSKAQSG